LIELMVVLTIITLIAGAMPFALNRILPARRVALTAQTLITNVRWLQIQSSVTGAPGRITLQPSGYQLHVREQKRQVELAHSTLLRFMQPETAAKLDELVLFPDGTGLPARIEISDSGRRVMLEMSMLSGRLRRTL
jgi:hypothetical protein